MYIQNNNWPGYHCWLANTEGEHGVLVNSLIVLEKCGMHIWPSLQCMSLDVNCGHLARNKNRINTFIQLIQFFSSYIFNICNCFVCIHTDDRWAHTGIIIYRDYFWKFWKGTLGPF